MTDSKQKRAAEIEQAIREALMQDWDPIGIADVPEAQGEYDSYVGPVYRLLVSGAGDTELIDYLYTTETDRMGLTRLGMRRHLKKVVARLRQIDVKL